MTMTTLLWPFPISLKEVECGCTCMTHAKWKKPNWSAGCGKRARLKRNTSLYSLSSVLTKPMLTAQTPFLYSDSSEFLYNKITFISWQRFKISNLNRLKGIYIYTRRHTHCHTHKEILSAEMIDKQELKSSRHPRSSDPSSVCFLRRRAIPWSILKFNHLVEAAVSSRLHWLLDQFPSCIPR